MNQAGEPDLTSTLRRILAMQIVVLLLSAGLIAACGGSARQVKGEAPQVGLEGLARSNGELLLNVSIRNVNDFRLEISGLTLRLEFDGEPVAETWSALGRLSIAPRGREVVQLTGTAAALADEQLQRLASGDKNNLRWHLNVVFDDVHRNSQPANARGFLHPVPGQPDRFR
jgi:LEA14-like dessication related protein